MVVVDIILHFMHHLIQFGYMKFMIVQGIDSFRCGCRHEWSEPSKAIITYEEKVSPPLFSSEMGISVACTIKTVINPQIASGSSGGLTRTDVVVVVVVDSNVTTCGPGRWDRSDTKGYNSQVTYHSCTVS